MTEQQTEMWDVLSELGGEEVLRVLTDWHGLRLSTRDSMGIWLMKATSRRTPTARTEPTTATPVPWTASATGRKL